MSAITQPWIDVVVYKVLLNLVEEVLLWLEETVFLLSFLRQVVMTLKLSQVIKKFCLS